MIFARRQAESLQAIGVEVSSFYLRSRTSPLSLVREFLRFRRELRRVNPDAVHAQFGTVTALFSALGAGLRPLLVTYRGSDLNPSPASLGMRAALGRLFSQLAALRATRAVCVSRQLRDRLWWRRSRAVVLPSGVDPDVFHPEPRSIARQRLGWSDAERVVLFNAGHDHRIKRLDLAQEAVAIARRSMPELRMEILDGNVAPELVPAMMNAADCLLVTSDAEGSPTVVQEALACNLPIVSVDVGDTVERLKGVWHARIVARNPEALGRAVAELVEMPLRSDGRSKLNEFSAERIAAELRRLYCGLCSNVYRSGAPSGRASKRF